MVVRKGSSGNCGNQFVSREGFNSTERCKVRKEISLRVGPPDPSASDHGRPQRCPDVLFCVESGIFLPGDLPFPA